MTKAVIQNQNTRLCVVLILIGVVPGSALALYPLFLYILNPIIASVLLVSVVKVAYFYWFFTSGAWVLMLLLILPSMMDPPADEQVKFRDGKTVDLKEYRKSNYGSVGDSNSLKDFEELEDVTVESPDLVKVCQQQEEQSALVNRNSSRAGTPLPENWKLYLQESNSNESEGSTNEQSVDKKYTEETIGSLQQVSEPEQKLNVDIIPKKEEETEEKCNEKTLETDDSESEDGIAPIQELIRQKGTQNEVGPMRCSEVTPLKIDVPETKEVFECSLPTPSSAKVKNQVFIFIPEPQN